MAAGDKEPGALAYRSVISLRAKTAPSRANALDDPDHRDGSVYLISPELELAVQVALVTGRPLLLRGRPGTGKSSLAPWIARSLGWRYFEHVVTARTRAQDLLYAYDNLRRLADAQARIRGDPELNDFDYVEPGPLWWLFDPSTAARRGAPPERPPRGAAREPNAELNASRRPGHAVLLIDEIDKADPDVPNNLLVALGSFTFRVEETGTVVERTRAPPEEETSRLLVLLTTNEERDLPDALLRRCVVHHLTPPDAPRLLEIGERHFPGRLDGPARELARRLAEAVVSQAKQAAEHGLRPPSTAEYLDALRACLTLRVSLEDAAWKQVERAVLLKPRALEDAEA